ncbi:DUF423 domain-containing protein [Wenyingzhuangia sp. chi5]|uniref:DUF423 domain-containing protein n=1 Tax=Wenyingzhuangia gilva TaxID=3057677 RepID=A0ABT8VVC3_9FLAO|nr:DUF423 domain-containing protein [Wenyingzhuangia sp. chi5]MDO3695923.1 DUF423 domain-containing protein [Wenyingzhuangia sp. chi5]
MKKWNFKAKNSPQKISEKIQITLESIKGLEFNVGHQKSNSINFKIRKRILYPFYLYFLNSIVVNGKLSKSNIENETDVEISFHQHFLWNFVIYSNILVGLGIITYLITGKDTNPLTYLIGIIIMSIGFILWIAIQKKYVKNIQEYKTLISDILEKS